MNHPAPSRLGFIVLATLVGGCGDPLLAYPLEAQRYDEARDCLDEEGVIDVIEGEARGTCQGVVCLLSAETGDLFVSKICEAPAGYDQLPADDSLCSRALAAFNREELCP